jgi:hypothetical protein
MKPNEIINIALGLAILIILGLASKMIFFPTDPKEIVDTVVQRDTLTRVDTVRIPKTVYVTKLQAKLDTIYVNNNPVQVAKADTILQKDSSKIKISYYFPPLNYFEAKFDIKEKIIETLKTITETKTITVEQPIYKQWTLWTTILSIVLFFLVK